MARFHVSVQAKDYDAAADLVRVHKLGVGRAAARPGARGGYRVRAIASSEQIRALEKAGYKVKRLDDVDREGRKRQAEHRAMLKAARATRAGVAKAGYLGVDQVEARLAAAAAPADGVAELIALPHRTWEGRTCHALRIGRGNDVDRPGVYLLGGIHAREWGSPDILIHLVERVTSAYRSGTSVKLGGKTFSAARVRTLVEGKDVFVFPQANPDGRHHSLTLDANWRKNRRPAPGGPDCVGVDLNRNYDFLWDFPKYFDPRAPIANSKDPCDPQVYIGPAPFSEPETRNVVWLLDARPTIRWFVDVHSFGETILYNWGDDVNQAADPRMSFRNRAYDRRRGIANDTAYREYMSAADRRQTVALARAMRNAIRAVRGREYEVQQSIGLYPTAGTSDDYIFSRHIVDPAKPKVYAYTVEWGRETNATPFHPPYSEMARIMDEVAAGLIEFSLRAA